MKINSTHNESFILRAPMGPYFIGIGILGFPLVLGLLIITIYIASFYATDKDLPLTTLLAGSLMVVIPIVIIVYLRKKQSFTYNLNLKSGYIELYNPKNKENADMANIKECELKLLEWWKRGGEDSDDIYIGPLINIQHYKFNLVIGSRNNKAYWRDHDGIKYPTPYYLYQKDWDRLIKALGIEEEVEIQE